MNEIHSEHTGRVNKPVRIGSQPMLLTAAALFALIFAIGSVVAWRSYTGASPEQERVTVARVNQARVAQASEQLVEKTRGIEETQQQSIDQLQVVQDQLVVMTKLLAAQQTETRKLNEQVGSLTGALDNIRQSFASAQAQPEAAPAPSVRQRPRGRARVAVTRGKPKAVVQRKRGGSRG
jgi:septal ring factor EnvC (AmiA/AmiB activator)